MEGNDVVDRALKKLICYAKLTSGDLRGKISSGWKTRGWHKLREVVTRWYAIGQSRWMSTRSISSSCEAVRREQLRSVRTCLARRLHVQWFRFCFLTSTRCSSSVLPTGAKFYNLAGCMPASFEQRLRKSASCYRPVS